MMILLAMMTTKMIVDTVHKRTRIIRACKAAHPLQSLQTWGGGTHKNEMLAFRRLFAVCPWTTQTAWISVRRGVCCLVYSCTLLCILNHHFYFPALWAGGDSKWLSSLLSPDINMSSFFSCRRDGSVSIHSHCSSTCIELCYLNLLRLCDEEEGGGDNDEDVLTFGRLPRKNLHVVAKRPVYTRKYIPVYWCTSVYWYA